LLRTPLCHRYKYDADLVGDEEDRKMLDELNERDRELLKADRYEERETALEQWNLLREEKMVSGGPRLVVGRWPATIVAVCVLARPFE
jgi:hypothetical protein